MGEEVLTIPRPHHSPRRPRPVAAVTLALLLAPTSCITHSLFSGVPLPDRSRPVAMIETRGGTEYGVTTRDGILFLGRTATEGPCRVHYFLGPRATPLVEDGTIQPFGGVYYRADIDLKTEAIHLLQRDLTPDDELVAMLYEGSDARTLPVHRAQVAGISGDVLDWPGEPLPAGTALLVEQDDGWRFAGMVAGELTLEGKAGSRQLLLFTGPDRLREALGQPQRYPPVREVRHRPDDITVVR